MTARPRPTSKAAVGVLLLFAMVGLAGALGLFWRSRLARADGGWRAVRVAFPRPDDRLRIGAEGHRLEVLVYEPEASPESPVTSILLVHGNRRAGANTGLYRLLAHKLAARGASVFAVSLPGFGGSDPFISDEPVTAEDFTTAVAQALDYQRTRSEPMRPRLIVGHSLGANLALATCGAPDLQVVAVEPGRRLKERVVAPNAPSLGSFTRKLRAHVRGGIVDSNAVRSLYDVLDPARSAPPVEPGNCTILYSRRLPDAERLAVERIAAAHPGSNLIWLGNRDHDFGVARLPMGVVYPGPTIDSLVGTILSLAFGAQFSQE